MVALAYSIDSILYANIKRGDEVLKIGIMRQVDSLGRIVIPKELRTLYQIETNDQIEIIGTDEGILLKVPGLEIKRIREEKWKWKKYQT